VNVKLIDFKTLGPSKGINYSRDHLRRKVKAGEFPRPIPVSDRRIAWIEAEVDQWLADKARARNQDEASHGKKPLVLEAGAPDSLDKIPVQAAALGVASRAEATDTESISPSPRGSRLALAPRARDKKQSVPRKAE
jgi:prophage regulatory protein